MFHSRSHFRLAREPQPSSLLLNRASVFTRAFGLSRRRSGLTSPTLNPGAANFWMDQSPTPNPTPPSGGPRQSPDEELSAYRRMLLIRRFEEKAGQLYGMGFIAGFCHLYIGQEAVVTGMMMALGEDDQIITAYRDHGHMLSTGMDPKGVMAELTGRRHGYSKGKGGSMHMLSLIHI